MNGATENGRSQDVNKLVGVREGKMMLNVENGSNRKEQERNTHAVGHRSIVICDSDFWKSTNIVRISVDRVLVLLK